MNKNVSTAIILDTRKKRKDDRHIVRLRVTYQRKQKYYSTKYVLTQDEYKAVMSPNSKGDNKKTKLNLQALEKTANDIITNLPEFDFDTFEKYLKSPKGRPSINSYYQTYIKVLNSEDRVNTAIGYKASLTSLLSFRESEQIYFNEIDVSFLRRYENWILKSGKSISTIGFYLRPLKAIFNLAIRDKVISELSYPFGKGKYQIPASSNTKKALSKHDLKRLYRYSTLEGTAEDKAKDYWFFSYLCNGINMKDMFRLKYKNIDFKAETITFIRAKTEKTNRQNLKPITAVLTPEIKTIIQKWGNTPTKANNYVFPVLSEDLTPTDELKKITQGIKTTNKYMKRIGVELDFNLKLTTYTARHTYSTILKNSGFAVSFISESLGHSSLKTTQNYLDSFDTESKKEAANKLLDF